MAKLNVGEFMWLLQRHPQFDNVWLEEEDVVMVINYIFTFSLFLFICNKIIACLVFTSQARQCGHYDNYALV